MYDFFTNLLTISIACTGIIVMIAVISRLLNKHYKANLQCIIWIVIALRLLIPTNITIDSISPIVIPKPNEIYINMPNDKNDNVTTTVTSLTITSQIEKEGSQQNSYKVFDATPSAPKQPFMGTESLEPSAVEKHKFDPIKILIAIWLLGIIVFIAIRVIEYYNFKTTIKKHSISICNHKFQAILDRIKFETGITKNIQLLYADNIISPMVTGIINPKLILPKIDYSISELYVVFRHELTHIKLHHLELKLLMLICEIMHWFNPGAYLMTRLFNRDLELSCDSNVMKITSNSYKGEYSKALLSVIKKVNSIST